VDSVKLEQEYICSIGKDFWGGGYELLVREADTLTQDFKTSVPRIGILHDTSGFKHTTVFHGTKLQVIYYVKDYYPQILEWI
jgi:hypothetical protein